MVHDVALVVIVVGGTGEAKRWSMWKGCGARAEKVRTPVER